MLLGGTFLGERVDKMFTYGEGGKKFKGEKMFQKRKTWDASALKRGKL